MLRSNKKYKKTTTPNFKQNPDKTKKHEHSYSPDIPNNHTNCNNNSPYVNYHTNNAKMTSKIHFKIPDFPANNKEYINQWLETCISLFQFNNIKDENEICRHIINNLPSCVLNKINDKLGKFVTAQKPLKELSNTLNKLYPNNPDRILEECYNEINLGDRKPSEYLADLTLKLRDENNQPNLTLIKFFFNRILPVNVKNILIANKHLSLEEQGTLADQIYLNDFNSINAVVQKYQKKVENTETMEFLLKKIEDLNQEIKTLKTNQTLHFHNTTPKPTMQRHPNFYPNAENNTFCFYHNKYGNKAFKCTPPCNFRNKHLNTDSHLGTHQN